MDYNTALAAIEETVCGYGWPVQATFESSGSVNLFFKSKTHCDTIALYLKDNGKNPTIDEKYGLRIE